MSGHKKATVTLSEDEYQRLHDAEMQLRFMKKKLPEMVQAEQDENLAVYQDNLARMQQRQEDYKEIVNQFDDQLRYLEMDTADALVIDQTAYTQLSELRLVLERQQSSWQILYQTSLLTGSLRRLEITRTCQL